MRSIMIFIILAILSIGDATPLPASATWAGAASDRRGRSRGRGRAKPSTKCTSFWCRLTTTATTAATTTTTTTTAITIATTASKKRRPSRSMQQLQDDAWHNDPWADTPNNANDEEDAHGTSPYHDNAELHVWRALPARHVRMLLTVIVQNTGLSERVNRAVITCLARATATTDGAWGAYAVDRYAPDLMHVDYFAHIPNRAAPHFVRRVDRYVEEGLLTACVHDIAAPDFADEGDIFAARVERNHDRVLVRRRGGAPAWFIGIIIALAVVIGVVVLVVFLCRPKNAGGKAQGLGRGRVDGFVGTSPHVQDPTDEDEFERALRAVAGPQRAAYV